MALQKFSLKQISKYVEHSDNKSTLNVILNGAKSCYKKSLLFADFYTRSTNLFEKINAIRMRLSF